jgi:1-acyl-sn-glycerol-3-phosphate acyltransferase
MQTSLTSFLISVYIWTFIILTILPLFLVYFVIWLLSYPFDKKKAIPHYFTFIWTRIYLTINPGWKVRIENKEKLDKRKKYVLISNHQSMIDIALVMQLKHNFRWISKIELARAPFVGWVIWLNDHILVRRGDKYSVVRMAEECKMALDQGISIFMFPEGTRSHDGKLQPFKEGAFIMAKNNRTPILPVVLDGASEALPRNAFWFKVNQTLTIRVLDEIPLDIIDCLDSTLLMEYVRVAMVNDLEKIRNADEAVKFHKAVS